MVTYATNMQSMVHNNIHARLPTYLHQGRLLIYLSYLLFRVSSYLPISYIFTYLVMHLVSLGGLGYLALG
jgi:hypothetical protein